MTKAITTTWEIRTYDVWGNAKDGYEVNDSFRHGTIELPLKPVTHKVGPESNIDFVSASPTDKQLRAIFGTREKLDISGDDVSIYVNRARDGYPLGEINCTSHSSLSQVRAREAS